MKSKIFEACEWELGPNESFAERLEKGLNDFLNKNPNVVVKHIYMNSGIFPERKGRGFYKDSPASMIVWLLILYEEQASDKK